MIVSRSVHFVLHTIAIRFTEEFTDPAFLWDTAVVSDDFSGVLKVGDDLKYIQFVATEYVADRILA